MKIKSLFPTRAMKQVNISWQEALESFRVMKSLLMKLILSLSDGLTKEWCIASHLFWKECFRLGKRSGWLFLALYLKQSRVALQRFAAQDSTPALTVYVSLTRSGIPRIIPSFHRKKIKEGDAAIIQLYLSLFSVSKLIALAPKVSKNTFATIIAPSDLESIQSVSSEMRALLKPLLVRYIPGIETIPLKQGLRFIPTWKSIPTGPWYSRFIRGMVDNNDKLLKSISLNCRSIFTCFPYEFASFQMLMIFCHSREDQFSQGCLWAPYIRYAFDPYNKWITPLCLDWFESRIGPYIPSSQAMGVPPIPGRLSQSCSGDGKRRLFAIGNYINQRLLEPVHKWLSLVLKRIPMDGTFDQVKPLDLLKGVSGTVYSIDLKAATDRWPLLLLFELIMAAFDRSFASSVVNSTLGQSVFVIDFVGKFKRGVSPSLKNDPLISFIAGQPLGYLASWPLFALSHHVLIWFAAEQVYPGKLFKRYAVLGDDVVIADTAVRDIYLTLLGRIGVKVSVDKCLTSSTGGCEFAKRFRLKRMTLDVSPLSIKKLLSINSPLGWYSYITTINRKLRVSTELRLMGVGFKACSRPLNSVKHGIRVKRLLIMRTHSLLRCVSLELCLATVLGHPIQPEVIGRLVYIMLEFFTPNDPILPPERVFPHPGMMDFNEYSLYRGWMEQYLVYLRWKSLLYLKPAIVLDDLLEVPIFIRTWFRPSYNEEEFKFGIMFRMYDIALQLQGDNLPRLLPLVAENPNENLPPNVGIVDNNLEIIRL